MSNGKPRPPKTHQPRYLTDEDGDRIGIVVDLAEYERMQEAEEELAAIRAYDLAKASGEKAVPFKEALRMLSRGK